MRFHTPFESLVRAAVLGGLAVLMAACDPEVEASHLPIQPDHGEDVIFRGSASDPDGISRIDIRVNGSVVKTCTDDVTCSHTMRPSALAFDFVRYEVEAVDGDGDSAVDGPYFYAVGRPWAFAGPADLAPVRVTDRASADAIDVCFVPDGDYGGDMALFRSHVGDKIFSRMFENEGIEENRHKYNFHLTTTPGSTASCATIPSSVRRAGTYCDTFALLHTTNMRDCSGSTGFGAEGQNTWTFIHELGHAIFGLSDEYAPDGVYWQPNPYPNVWTSEAACRADAPTFGGDPDECTEICETPGCGSGFWRYGTATTVMVRGFSFDAWGPHALRRLNWIHSSY